MLDRYQALTPRKTSIASPYRWQASPEQIRLIYAGRELQVHIPRTRTERAPARAHADTQLPRECELLRRSQLGSIDRERAALQPAAPAARGARSPPPSAAGKERLGKVASAPLTLRARRWLRGGRPAALASPAPPPCTNQFAGRGWSRSGQHPPRA